MVYPNASGVPINMLPITDSSAFDQLKLLVDREGDDFASADMRGMLASIGIVKGQPFKPDARAPSSTGPRRSATRRPAFSPLRTTSMASLKSCGRVVTGSIPSPRGQRRSRPVHLTFPS